MLRRLRRLAAGDLALAAEAWWWILRVRSMLRRRSLPEVQRRLAEAAATRPTTSPPSAVRIREAVARAHRRLPSTTCLPLALVAQLMLRRAGREARLVIGVARPDAAASTGPIGPALDAHAWTESEGIIVAGEGALGRYAPLAPRAPSAVLR